MLDGEETNVPFSQAREALAHDLLYGLVNRMGYALEVDVGADGERIVLNLQGEGASELVGCKGQTLDALQFLLNRMLSRKGSGDNRPVVVDSEGYRERRIEALKELAGRLGDKAIKTGKIVAVNPMSAHDRRVIHMALRETPGISTRSEGEGPERRLLIVPER
jgi:spoIIIJ-associated protein